MNVGAEPSSAELSNRDAFRSMAALSGGCLAVAALGLWLLLSEIAPGLGLVAFYTGAPVSAIFGVIGGGVVLAWPLDITVSLVTGFLFGRLASTRGRPFWHGTLMGAAIFLVAAIVWNLLVTADPDWVQVWTSRES